MRLPHRVPRQKKRRCPVTRKIKYRDDIAAKIALGLLAAMPLREHREQRAYHCQFCKGWHLTSQEAR